MFDKLEDLLIRFEEIMGELHEPTVTNNQERFRKLMKEQSDLTPIVDAYTEYKKCKQDIEDSLSMLEEEKDGINDFIKKEGIKVISQSEFYAQDSTTNVEENEYVQLASGVYMQIVDKGSENAADTVKNNDEVLVRFMEYSILDKDTTLSNLNAVETVDAFRYAVTPSSIAGTFLQGYMMTYYSSPTVPAGWLVPLTYVRDMAHVKLIVPSKMGHQTAMQYVYPYFYDIRKYQIWK